MFRKKHIHPWHSLFSFIHFHLQFDFINNSGVFLFLYYTKIYRNGFTGSHGTLLGVINAFVHVIMYSYYFLTSYRPELRDSLWWKKHITQIQLVSVIRPTTEIHSFSKSKEKANCGSHSFNMCLQYHFFSSDSQIQFGILVIHFMNPIFFFECGWPKTLSIIGVIQNLFMFILFLDFYLKAYVKKSKD